MKQDFGILLLSIMLLLILAGPGYSGDAGRESQFSLGSGVRAVGLGGGFVGIADDASAIYWNQAGLALLQNQEFNFMHATLFEGSIYDVANYVYPHQKLGGFGASFMRLGTGNIIKRVDWNESGEIDYSISQMILAYGRKLEGGFCIGTALKIVNQSLDNNSTYGVGLDLSFYRPVYRNVTAGILFQDIVSPRLRLGSNPETLPYDVYFGAGIRDLSILRNLRYNVNLAVEKPEDRSVKMHIGLETIYRNWFDFRTGYDRDNLTFGMGLYLGKMKFDYAYRIMNGITDSHRFGFSFRIGMSIAEKAQREIDLQKAHGSYIILNDRQQQFEFYKGLADSYYLKNNLDSAYVYFNRALAYKDDDPDTQGKIARINTVRQNLMEQQRTAISEEQLNRSILDGYYVRAEELYNQELYQASLNIAEVALKTDPADGRFVTLKDNASRAIEVKVMTLLNEADQAEKQGRMAEAVAAYNKILVLSPNDLTARKLAGEVGNAIDAARLISSGVESFYLGRLSLAEMNFNDVLKIAPDNIVAREYLNKIAALREKPSEQGDLEKDETVWKIYLDALELYRNGDYEKAIGLWQEVLKYYPGNQQTLNNIEQARLRLQK